MQIKAIKNNLKKKLEDKHYPLDEDGYPIIEEVDFGHFFRRMGMDTSLLQLCFPNYEEPHESWLENIHHHPHCRSVSPERRVACVADVFEFIFQGVHAGFYRMLLLGG